jgi:hypothetical protein
VDAALLTTDCLDGAELAPPPVLTLLSYRPSAVWFAVPILALAFVALRRRRAQLNRSNRPSTGVPTG